MKIDIVIPFYNEESCASTFLTNLMQAFSAEKGLKIRLLLVNDGSSDNTADVLDEASRNDHRLQVIHLWGNHGHQRALIAGLDHASGDAVLMMDGDGQHPPVHAVAMVKKFIELNGAVDIIQAVRSGSQDGWFKNATSKLFYRVQKLLMPGTELVPGAADFRVISRRACLRLSRCPDRHRNLRVLIASMRLSTELMPYPLEQRLSGKSRYDLKQMMTLAADGWFAFSLAPLRLSFFLMMTSLALIFAYLIYVIYAFSLGITIPGWASLVALIVFLFSILFGVLAIISEYVARIYTETRRHPVYELQNTLSSPAQNENKPWQTPD